MNKICAVYDGSENLTMKRTLTVKTLQCDVENAKLNY